MGLLRNLQDLPGSVWKLPERCHGVSGTFQNLLVPELARKVVAPAWQHREPVGGNCLGSLSLQTREEPL